MLLIVAIDFYSHHRHFQSILRSHICCCCCSHSHLLVMTLFSHWISRLMYICVINKINYRMILLHPTHAGTHRDTNVWKYFLCEFINISQLSHRRLKFCLIDSDESWLKSHMMNANLPFIQHSYFFDLVKLLRTASLSS